MMERILSMYSNNLRIKKLIKHCNKYVDAIFNREKMGEGWYSKWEVLRYNKLIESYWDPNGNASRFHKFNIIRTNIIYQCLSSDDVVNIAKARPEFKDYRILVVGSGGGLSSESLAELNLNVVGIEPNPELMIVAKNHLDIESTHLKKNLLYFQTTLQEFSRDYPHKFDGVVVSDVLEFLSKMQQRNFLDKCVHLCKPGGDLFVSCLEPSADTRKWCLLFWIEQFLRRKPCLIVPFYRGIMCEACEEILELNDCNIMNTYGIRYDALIRKFVYSENRDNWYFIHAKKKTQTKQEVI